LAFVSTRITELACERQEDSYPVPDPAPRCASRASVDLFATQRDSDTFASRVADDDDDDMDDVESSAARRSNPLLEARCLSYQKLQILVSKYLKLQLFETVYILVIFNRYFSGRASVLLSF
jgi:hypothetical protein